MPSPGFDQRIKDSLIQFIPFRRLAAPDRTAETRVIVKRKHSCLAGRAGSITEKSRLRITLDFNGPSIPLLDHQAARRGATPACSRIVVGNTGSDVVRSHQKWNGVLNRSAASRQTHRS